MADNAQIIANTENIEQVLITFSGQLDDYVDKMNNDIDRLRNAIGALRGGWESEDYDTFAKSIEAKLGAIKNELDVAKKLKEYLDEGAAEIHQFIETLRAAGSR